MISRRPLKGRLDRERGKRRAAAPPADGAALTPFQKLVRAAETGRLEALVRKARPAQPVAMVTPEEREAELRAHTPEPKPKVEPVPAVEESKPEPTASELYIAEHCRWVPLSQRRHRPRIPYGRCLTEYDWYTGELIGDGYARYGDDEEW